MIDLAPLFGPQDMLSQDLSLRVFPRSGEERWLLEARFRRPWHLETWPRANLRARAIYIAARIFGSIGFHLPSRRVTVTMVPGCLYHNFRSRFEVISVFLGTPGPNRKFVVFAKQGGKSWFIKVPVSQQSAELASAEAKALTEINGDDALAAMVPQHFWIENSLAIEDVATGGTTYARLDDNELLRVHKLLFSRSQTTQTLEKLALNWTTGASKQPEHANPKARAMIDATRHAALRFLGSLNSNLQVECYMAHGDFTQWNVLRAKDGTAKIIDWELFGLRPKYFDVFHYKVSHAILVDKVSPKLIYERISSFEKVFLKGMAISPYFGLYVARQALDYCDVFSRQPDLPDQAFWQLKAWTELLNRALITDENSD